MGLIVLLFSSSERLLQTMSSIMHSSHSHWKECAVDTHMYPAKHCNVADKARRCCYDPLFMLVMFCCLTPLSGSAATPAPALEIHRRSGLRPSIPRPSKEAGDSFKVIL